MSRCICEPKTPLGCLCRVIDSLCWAITGNGSQATPFVISPKLDPNPNNLASCTAAGLKAITPAAITNPPAVQAYHSLNQAITNNTLTATALNSEHYDTNTMHSNTVNNSRVTFTTAGTYVVTFVCMWDKNAVGNRMAYIRKNGIDLLAFDSKKTGGADLFVGHTLVVQDAFLAGDYVEGLVQHTKGSNLTLLADSVSPVLSASIP